MEILGIGPSELLFIVVLALIILGPRDMQKAGKTIGRWLRQVVTSDGWKFFQQTSREIQTLPNRLMRESALEELKEMDREVRKPLQSGPEGTLPSLGTPSSNSDGSPEAADPSHSIAPPSPAREPKQNA